MKLRVDMDAIIDAATAPPQLGEPYLDVTSGEVAWLSDSMDGEDELADDIEAQPDRFSPIPRYESRDELALMRRFAASIDEQDVRERLELALGGKGAFSRFREVLRRYQDVDARWEQMKEAAVLDHLKAWLAELGIEPSYERRKIDAARTVPRPTPAPPLGLFDLLLLGAPDGKTELIEGRVYRHIRLPNPSDARGLFKRLARELSEHHGVAWRNRFIEGKSSYDVDRAHLSVEDATVELAIDVPRAVWDACSR